MNKKFLYTLIAIVAILALNAINSGSIHSNHFSQNKQHILDKRQPKCAFNEFNFISETEDDFRDSKFQNNISNTFNVDGLNFKKLTNCRSLLLNTLHVFQNTLYQGVPYYISVGNLRV